MTSAASSLHRSTPELGGRGHAGIPLRSSPNRKTQTFPATSEGGAALTTRAGGPCSGILAGGSAALKARAKFNYFDAKPELLEQVGVLLLYVVVLCYAVLCCAILPSLISLDHNLDCISGRGARASLCQARHGPDHRLAAVPAHAPRSYVGPSQNCRPHSDCHPVAEMPTFLLATCLPLAWLLPCE